MECHSITSLVLVHGVVCSVEGVYCTGGTPKWFLLEVYLTGGTPLWFLQEAYRIGGTPLWTL